MIPVNSTEHQSPLERQKARALAIRADRAVPRDGWVLVRDVDGQVLRMVWCQAKADGPQAGDEK